MKGNVSCMSEQKLPYNKKILIFGKNSRVLVAR